MFIIIIIIIIIVSVSMHIEKDRKEIRAALIALGFTLHSILDIP